MVGSDTELVEAVVKQMGYDYEIRMLPWKRVEIEAGIGKIDMVYSITDIPSRAEHYFFSDPISVVGDTFFKRKKDHITFKKLEDLSRYRIGTSADYNYSPEFMALVANHTLSTEAVVGTAPELQNFLKLTRGRIDLFICEKNVCNYYIRKHGAIDPIFNTLDYIDQSTGGERLFRVGLPKGNGIPGQDKKSARLLEEFNRAPKAIPKAQKTLIYDKYYVDTKQ